MTAIMNGLRLTAYGVLRLAALGRKRP